MKTLATIIATITLTIALVGAASAYSCGYVYVNGQPYWVCR